MTSVHDLGRGSAPGLFAAAILLGAFAPAAADDPADLVLRNGKIYTVDPARSVQQAVAVRGDTIVAVGSDADVAPLIGPWTSAASSSCRA